MAVKHLKLRDLRELKKVMESKVKIRRYAKFEEALLASSTMFGWGPIEFEFKFHPVRKWRADYAFPSAKLLMEVEGGFFSGGRHSRGGGAVKDMEKYNMAEIMGYHILRFIPSQVEKLEALGSIGAWFSQNKRETI